MSTFMQWVHLSAAVICVGGMAFMLLALFPAAVRLEQEQRDSLLNGVLGRFRWVSWSMILLLVGSGLYNVKLVWLVPWGPYWRFLAIKIALALAVFLIILCLTIPLRVFDGFRRRLKQWVYAAFWLALIVILISAYLRRG
ncbi:MAG TPA: hypothetical protein VJW77_05945 [Terriglobia bacterium]|nr:hypothetical protein [Terriglobia bacterium]